MCAQQSTKGPGDRQRVASSRPLAGRRIALPETRELERLADLLESDGAEVVRCPLVAILDAPADGAVDAWLRMLAADGLDDVIFLTGEGVRRLWERARRVGVQAAVLRGLARTRKIVRGPKPARALHELGLSPDISSTDPTSQGVAAALAAHPMAGRTVGLQLFGDDPAEGLRAALEASGARVLPVAPYRYAPASDDERVVSLISALAAGTLDAIAFTSAPQVERLWAVARGRKLEDELRGGLARVTVAAVGPVVRRALEERQVRIDVMPSPQFYMRRLTAALTERLGVREIPSGEASTTVDKLRRLSSDETPAK